MFQGAMLKCFSETGGILQILVQSLDAVFIFIKTNLYCVERYDERLLNGLLMGEIYCYIRNVLLYLEAGEGAISIGHPELRGCLELSMTPEFQQIDIQTFQAQAQAYQTPRG